MSIASAIATKQQQVVDSYTAVSNKGGTLPTTQNLTNLAAAISTIPSGGSATLITKSITQNGTYNASSDNADGYSSVTVNVSGGGTSEVTYGNYYIMEDDSVLPVYFDRINISGSNLENIILSDAVTDMDNTQRLCSIYLLSYGTSNISNMSFQLNNLRKVRLSTTGLSSLGIKKIVYKSVTEQFYALYEGVLNVVGTSASTLTTIDLSNATSIYMRSACVGLTALEDVKMDKAENVTIIRNTAATGGTFKNTSVTELRFPSLKTTSIISIQYMLSNLNGCTVHFPSNLQTIISGLTGYPNFGGTNTVLAFDLPATS